MTSLSFRWAVFAVSALLTNPSFADNDVPVLCFQTSDFSEPNSLSERQIGALHKRALKAVPDIERGAIRSARLFTPEKAKARDTVLLTDICEDDGKVCVGLAFPRRNTAPAQEFWYGPRGLTRSYLNPDSMSNNPFAKTKFFFPAESKGVYTISWARYLGPPDLVDFSWKRFFASAKIELEKSDALEDVFRREVPECFLRK